MAPHSRNQFKLLCRSRQQAVQINYYLPTAPKSFLRSSFWAFEARFVSWPIGWSRAGTRKSFSRPTRSSPGTQKFQKLAANRSAAGKSIFAPRLINFIVGMWRVEKWVERSSDYFDQCRVLWSFWAIWAVVVAQLVEWLLPTPEICSFEPCHWQNLIYQFIYQLYNRKDENKEKDAKNGPPF